eukprot:TRINITY_DN49436_c0_g1_i1.p1 TRINITY_DN49436_c0_g1~~TRINITY_DN49436_c0_g1_i1.p1  ORF type:complete len:120 (-),score=27.70 TRINITY_DN49436_c0_g1_i1:246-605(-)
MFFFFLMIRRPPRSTLSSSSAASDVYKRQQFTTCFDAYFTTVLMFAPTTPAQIHESLQGDAGQFITQRMKELGHFGILQETTPALSGSQLSKKCVKPNLQCAATRKKKQWTLSFASFFL